MTLLANKPRSEIYLFGAIALIAVLLRVALVLAAPGFAAEDAFITYRYSERIASGQGFTFNDGERVLGTTTPLWTLILVLPSLLPSDLAVIYFSQLLDVLLDVGTLWVLFLLIRHELAGEAAGTPSILYIGLALLPTAAYGHSVINGVNGMETSLTVFLMALSLYWATVGRHALGGAALGLLVMARPDGIVWCVVLCLAHLLVSRSLRSTATLAAALLLVYSVWGVFAQLYFGSPVPQSVSAKNGFVPARLMDIGSFLFRVSWYMPRRIAGQLSDFVDSSGAVNIPAVLPFALPFLLVALAALWFYLRRRSLMSAWPAFFVLYAYSMSVGNSVYFERYLQPGYVAISICAAAVGFMALRRFSFFSRRAFQVGLVSLLGLALAATTTVLIRQNQQTIVPRYQDYRALGLWLRENTDEDDLILLEPLGYAGYYSMRTIRDYPALVAPDILEYQAQYGRTWLFQYIHDVPVEIIILRPREFNYHLWSQSPPEERLAGLYEPVFSIPTDEIAVYRRIHE
jgi:hypothetical protein